MAGVAHGGRPSRRVDVERRNRGGTAHAAALVQNNPRPRVGAWPATLGVDADRQRDVPDPRLLTLTPRALLPNLNARQRNKRVSRRRRDSPSAEMVSLAPRAPPRQWAVGQETDVIPPQPEGTRFRDEEVVRRGSRRPAAIRSRRTFVPTSIPVNGRFLCPGAASIWRRSGPTRSVC
jgi:hypothetical protein